ncbi:MAG: hypothetical protein DRO11_10410, partial [Methanobacteriota archaeon]
NIVYVSGNNTKITVTGNIPDGTNDGNVRFYGRKTINKIARTTQFNVANDPIVEVYESGDWVEKEEGVDYTIDDGSGEITFIAGKEPNNDAMMRVTCYFHKPVRFDSKLSFTYELENRVSGEISVVEVEL